jgi:hypothetical protein
MAADDHCQLPVQHQLMGSELAGNNSLQHLQGTQLACNQLFVLPVMAITAFFVIYHGFRGSS